MNKDYIRYFYNPKEHRTTLVLRVFNISRFLEGWTLRLHEEYHGNAFKRPKTLKFWHFGDLETAINEGNKIAAELILNGYKELKL